MLGSITTSFSEGLHRIMTRWQVTTASPDVVASGARVCWDAGDRLRVCQIRTTVRTRSGETVCTTQCSTLSVTNDTIQGVNSCTTSPRAAIADCQTSISGGDRRPTLIGISIALPSKVTYLGVNAAGSR